MIRICAVAVVLFVAVASAKAGGFDDFNHGIAASQHGDYDAAISLLSHALSADDLAQDLRPVAYVSLGDAYLGKYKYTEAIADFAAALRLRPLYFEASFGRLEALAARGDIDAAATECRTFLKAWPNTFGTYAFCGRMDWAMGNYSQSAAEFETALELDPRNPYDFLWLWLAVKHTTSEPRSRLAQFGRAIDVDRWPAPIVDVYRGDGSLERAEREADDGDDQTKRNRACEVGFYGGEWQLLRGDVSAGRTLLQQAARYCPESYIELAPAKTELKRLSTGTTQ